MSQFHLTLKALRENGACKEGYNNLVQHLAGVPQTGEDEFYFDEDAYGLSMDSPIHMSVVLASNGIMDASYVLEWCDSPGSLEVGIALCDAVYDWFGEERLTSNDPANRSYILLSRVYRRLSDKFICANTKTALTNHSEYMELQTQYVVNGLRHFAALMEDFMSEIDNEDAK